MFFRLRPLWLRVRLTMRYVFCRLYFHTMLIGSSIRKIPFPWRIGDILGNHSISVIPVRCGMMGKHRHNSYILWGVDAGFLIQVVILPKVRQWSSLPRLVTTSMDALHTNRPILHPVCFVQRSNIWLCFEALHTNRKTPHWLLYHLSLLSELVL